VGLCADHRQELLVDDDLALEQVQTVDREPEALPLTHSGARCERDQGPKVRGHRRCDRRDLLRGRRDNLPLLEPWQSRASARVRSQRSRTADFITDETMLCMTPMVDGASGLRFAALSPVSNRFTQI
jgi:hypothetical protein